MLFFLSLYKSFIYTEIMEFTFIYWILLVFSGLIWFTSVLIPIAVMSEDNNESSLYCIPVGILFSCFSFISLIHIYSFEISRIIWIILVGLSFLAHLGLIIYHREDSNKHYSISFILSLLLIPFPLIVDNSLQTSRETIYINFHENHYFIIASIVILLLISITLILTYNRNRRINRNLLNRLYSLEDKIESFYIKNTKFEEPYNKYFREEISLLIQNNKVFQSNLTSTNRYFDEINKSLDSIKKQLSYSSNKSNRKRNRFDEDSNEQEWTFELANIKQMLEKVIQPAENSKIYNEENLDIVRELNHFIATPLSSIIANTEIILLKTTEKEFINENLTAIKENVELCKCVIETYREIATVTDNSENIVSSINKLILSAFKMYRSVNKKINIDIDTNLPDIIPDYSNHYIISIIIPLVENAVVASPDNSDIKCLLIEEENCFRFELCNYCINLPKLSDLRTQGYSSKPNHKGSGLMIVRHLIQSKNGTLDVDIVNEAVLFKITLPKRR